MNYNKLIDHTNLKADCTKKDVKRLCEEALMYDFYSVCVAPCFVKDACKYLKNSNILVGSVVGFPLGTNTIKTKVSEAKECIKNGAQEIDYVINISKLKSKDLKYIKKEMTSLRKVCNNICLKAILEVYYIDSKNIITIIELAKDCGIDFIKTSTGFGPRGVLASDVSFFKQYCSDIKIKASGGISSFSKLKEMIDAGAQRIGTSSAIKIMEEICQK